MSRTTVAAANHRRTRSAPAAPRERPSRGPIVAAVVLVVAWAALFQPLLTAGEVFVLGDARMYRPFAEFSRARWQERHERTFWNPYVFMGVSASASLADSRPQYLPDAALSVSEAVRPGRFNPMGAPLFVHLLGMLGAAALAWALWRLPAVGLVWAGLAWGFSPLLLVPFAFGHDAYLAASALLPIVLLAVLGVFRAARTRTALGAGLGLALVTGLQALTGHPQMVIYSGLFAAAFAIHQALATRRPARLAIVAGALAWGAAMAMAVWWPAMLYGDVSNRGGVGGVPLATIRTLSISWYELATLVWPLAVGGSGATYWGGLTATDYPRFVGTLVVVLALVACFGRRSTRPAGRGFLLGTALVAIALALGPRIGPVYALVHDRVPFFSRFRVASMGIPVAAFALSLLSAAAFARAPDTDAPPRRRTAILVAGALAVVLVIGAGLAAGPLVPAYVALAHHTRPLLDLEQAADAAHAAGVDLAVRAALLGAALALFAVWRHSRRAPQWAAAGLLVLLVADLAMVFEPVLARATGLPATLLDQPEPELAKIGARDTTARVLSLRTFDVSQWQVAGRSWSAEMRLNDWIRWRAHAYGGEHGTPPSSWEGLDILSRVDAMRALGIVYLSSIPGAAMDTSVMTPVTTTENEAVYRLRDALGRAYAVPRVVALAGDREVLHAMGDPAFDPAQVAYTLDRGTAGEYPGAAATALRWVLDQPDAMAVDVSAPARTFVVVADSWFPGWHATLDGARVPMTAVNHLLRGFAVPAGTHRLGMRFVPEGWPRGVRVTRVALGLWLLGVAAWLALTLRRRAPAPAGG